MSRKLGATPLFGKAAERQKIPPIPGVLQNRNGAFLRNKKPGLSAARAFLDEGPGSYAAGLNSFEALFLIGSTVSFATFWDSSASSLP